MSHKWLLFLGLILVWCSCSGLAAQAADATGGPVQGASGASGPILVEIDPPPNTVVSDLTCLEVIFDDNVKGVEAADLLINGRPATNLVVYSPRDYLFEFPQPALGTVVVTWSAIHGITYQAGVTNAFAGDGWTYTLASKPTTAVIISEFMAENHNGIRDDLDNRSDWIELYNPGPTAANLAGWFLSGNSNRPTQWQFPNLTLAPNQYLVVWASGADRANPAAPLHTNFKLNKDGDYLALLDPWTNLVSAFAPSYPAQQADISYGRDRLDPSVLGYFVTPTPGAPNSTTGRGFAPDPVFSLASGVYTNSSLSLTLSAPSGTIYYTLNGSEPRANSTVYVAPITMSVCTVIKARVFQTGLLPSRMAARTYFLVDASARAFNSNLPLLVISTSGRSIPQDFRLTNAAFTVIDTYRGRSSLLQPPEFQGLCQIEVRGQSSAGFPKTPYRVEINDELGNDLNVSILGLPADADWVLRNPYSDKCMMNDFLACELHEKMGHYATRRRFVEVFVSTFASKLSYPQNYQGIYVLLDKIEAGPNRVNITQMSPTTAMEPDLTGGYIIKKDKASPGDIVFTTTGGGGFSGQQLRYHEPKPVEITPVQQNWIRDYLNQFERTLYAPAWLTATGTNHYSWYIDTDSFVDYHWIVEFTKQIDGYRLSNYLHKDRGGKLFMDPIWDWNLAFGNANYNDGWLTNGWYYSLCGENDHIWLRRLISGTTSPTGASGDPDFNQKIIDRWSVLRTNILAASNVNARIDEIAATLSEAAVRDFAKYPRLGTYVWPNPAIYTTPTTYQGIITAMKQWVQGRYAWIDSQFLRAPALNAASGRVPYGFKLTLSAPVGTIYYTLDGSDPRLPGGTMSPRSAIYRAPLPLTANVRVVARVRNGNQWSGPIAATLVVQTPPLAITEIMYHPAKPLMASTNLDEDFEYLEFMNQGSVALDLGGFQLSGTVAFTFPKLIVQPGQHVLVVRNQAAFQARYGLGLLIAGEYTGKLGNGGGHLYLRGALQEPILDFNYDPHWYPITDGVGFSLVAVDEAALPPASSLASAWRPSRLPYGSPGQTDPTPLAWPRIVINEALTHSAPANPDAIELLNLSTTTADVSGWFLTDHFSTPKKYRILPGTLIAPGGFRVFTAADFNDPSRALEPFGLSALGEEVYLFSGDAETNLTGYVHGFSFGAQLPEVTFGRHVTSTGEERFVAQHSPTLGATNAGPRVGPVVINEIMYHPPDVFANGAYWNNTEDEYVELFNPGGAPAPLFNLAFPTNTWRLSGAVEYAFPTNLTLGAGSYLLVVGFDPLLAPAQLAAFRAKYNVPSGVPILGPFQGSLDNNGGNLELLLPDTPVLSGAEIGQVPWVLVEAIHYADQSPWPPAADGLGHALHRKDPALFGDDPAHWDAVAPSPGRPYAGGSPPGFASWPQSRTALTAQTVTFNATVTNAASARYQWRLNGTLLPGATNASLILTNVQLSQTGVYQLVVWNATGSAASPPVWLGVDTDNDGDGMGDNWELANGLNPFDPTDAAADPDRDGLSNLSEYLAGTDPHDPQSCLKLNAEISQGLVTLQFNSVSNRAYAVQAVTSLLATNWFTLADIASRPTNATVTVTEPATNTTRFYRVLCPARP